MVAVQTLSPLLLVRLAVRLPDEVLARDGLLQGPLLVVVLANLRGGRRESLRPPAPMNSGVEIGGGRGGEKEKENQRYAMVGEKENVSDRREN